MRLQERGSDSLARDVAEQQVERGIRPGRSEEIDVVARHGTQGLVEEGHLPAVVPQVGPRQEGSLDARRCLEIPLQGAAMLRLHAIQTHGDQRIGQQPVALDRAVTDDALAPGADLQTLERHVDAAQQAHHLELAAVGGRHTRSPTAEHARQPLAAGLQLTPQQLGRRTHRWTSSRGCNLYVSICGLV